MEPRSGDRYDEFDIVSNLPADVVAKSKGSSNPYNLVRATFDALQKQTSPRAVASRRGKKVADVLGRRGVSAVAE